MADFTGDRRADLVFTTANAPAGMKLARNRVGHAGEPILTDPALVGPLHISNTDEPFVHKSTSGKVDLDDPSDGTAFSHVWTQAIDVNGDGRLDFIDAREVPGKWAIYINAPVEGDPNAITWVRHEFDTTYLRTKLQQQGYAYALHTNVPLSRNESIPMAGGISLVGGTLTATSWQLGDLNADGHIDLLVDVKKNASTEEGELAVIYGTESFDHWLPDSELVRVGGCGIRRTVSYNGGTRLAKDIWTLCELRDVNGDGLADSLDYLPAGQFDVKREIYHTNFLPIIDVFLGSIPAAHLGTGQGFTSAPVMVLPGPQRSDTAGCPPPDFGPIPMELATVVSTYRDVTGDGVLDYMDGTTVRIGTGAGYASGVLGPALIEHTNIQCSSMFKYEVWDGAEWTPRTVQRPAGESTFLLGTYFDVDGDGRLEFIESIPNQPNWLRHVLIGRRGNTPEPRALSAGKLIAMENGYGVRTEITYASAKDDFHTAHQIPSSEIVIDSVTTIDEGKVARMRYAYGDPLFTYDPLENRFRSFGYRRTVSLLEVEPGQGNATITDRYGLALEVSSDQARFESALKTGRTRDVTLLSGEMDDPWTLLTVNAPLDLRAQGSTHYDYGSKFFRDVSTGLGCDFLDASPYEIGQIIYSGMNTCLSRGFLFTQATSSWRGTNPLDEQNVRSESRVVAMDDFGRVTQAYSAGDTRRDEDNLCVYTRYAKPPANALPRVLDAVDLTYSTTADANGTCSTWVMSGQRTEYDGLPPGKVGNGWPTAQFTDRHHVPDQPVREIRLWDAQYDALGNVVQLSSDSGDGRTRRVSTTAFDPFQLVGTAEKVEATGTVTTDVQLTLDPLTLQPRAVRDANGFELGTRYDGFGRPTMTTVTPPGEPEGALAWIQYEGFAGLDASGQDPDGPRRTIEKTFDNPVPPGAVGIAQGHVATTTLDAQGRPVSSVVGLGSDYNHDQLIAEVTYDAFGRVSFATDPYPASQASSQPYGTTNLFNVDGTLKCAIRGYGQQPPTAA